MSRTLCVIAICFMLAGCASVQTSQNPNATPEQIQAAKEIDCATARAMVEQADLEMKQPGISEEAKTYWARYSFIPRITIAMVCVPVPK